MPLVIDTYWSVTALLIISLVIVVYQGSGVTAQDDLIEEPIAIETKNRAVTIIHTPKYVAQTKPNNQSLTKPDLSIYKPEQRPPSKPPNIPDKLVIQNVNADVPWPRHGQIQKVPSRLYSKQPTKLQHSANSVYKFPRVIPLPPHHRTYYLKPSRPLVYAASTGGPIVVKSPKFSLPAQVINGIRTDFVKPPKISNTTSSTSTSTSTTEATTTTTEKVLRTKRIWPKRVQHNANSTLLHNTTLTKDNTTFTKTNTTDQPDRDTSESKTHRTRFAYRNTTTVTTTIKPTPSTPRVYRPVTRKLKVKTTTPLPPINFTKLEQNDWVPIMPSHYPTLKKAPPPSITKRSDLFSAPPVESQMGSGDIRRRTTRTT